MESIKETAKGNIKETAKGNIKGTAKGRITDCKGKHKRDCKGRINLSAQFAHNTRSLVTLVTHFAASGRVKPQ